MGRGDLSEAGWRIFEELLPESRRKHGRPPEDTCDVINGILWRLRTGAAWRDVPERYGDWNKIYRRFRRWNEADVWRALATTLAEAMGDSSHHSIDSTTVRGHVSAAGAKGGLANRRLAARGPDRFLRLLRRRTAVAMGLRRGGRGPLLLQATGGPGL